MQDYITTKYDCTWQNNKKYINIQEDSSWITIDDNDSLTISIHELHNGNFLMKYYLNYVPNYSDFIDFEKLLRKKKFKKIFKK